MTSLSRQDLQDQTDFAFGLSGLQLWAWVQYFCRSVGSRCISVFLKQQTKYLSNPVNPVRFKEIKSASIPSKKEIQCQQHQHHENDHELVLHHAGVQP